MLDIDKAGIQIYLSYMANAGKYPSIRRLKEHFEAKIHWEHARLDRLLERRSSSKDHMAGNASRHGSVETMVFWKNMFESQLLSGHVRVEAPIDGRPLQTVRARYYASRWMHHDNHTSRIEGFLFTSEGGVVMDTCGETVKLPSGADDHPGT